MAKKIRAALPPDLNLGGAWVVEWDAVDPTTGASVAGVVISDTSIRIEGTGDFSTAELQPGPFMLVPGPNA
jgi:hypothetical protein